MHYHNQISSVDEVVMYTTVIRARRAINVYKEEQQQLKFNTVKLD